MLPKKYIFCIVLLFCVGLLSSCGKNDSLAGTWESGSAHWSAPSQMVINQDGSCTLDGMPSYSWSVENEVILFENPQFNYRKEFEYQLKNDTLTLKDEVNGEIVYHRQ